MTVFLSCYGHYEFAVESIGLSNAPVAFKKLREDVFREHLDKCTIFFVDDILIYCRSIEEHAEHLRTVLGKLGEHQLFASCGFLGSCGSEAGVALVVKTTKISALSTRKRYKDLKRYCHWLRLKIMCLTGYCRTFHCHSGNET